MGELLQFRGLFEQEETNEDDKVIISGYASTEKIDSKGTIILSTNAKAIVRIMDDFMRNPVLMAVHDNKKISSLVGKVLEYRVDKKGLWIRAVISQADDCKDIRTKIREDVLKGFSIGFVPKKIQVQKVKGQRIPVISDYKMGEVSLVPIPSNPDTFFEMEKRMIEDLLNKEIKKVENTINLTPEEYKELLSAKVIAEQEKRIFEDETKNLKKNEVENEVMIADFEKRIADYDNNLKELTSKIEEMEKRAMESNIRLELPEATKETVSGTQEDGVDYSKIDGRRFADLESEYIQHKVFEENRSTIDYTRRDVLKYHLGADFDTRTITSSNGIMKVNKVDYDPIAMDDVRTPMLSLVPQEMQDSKTFEYYKQTAKPTALFASEGFTPTATSSTYSSDTESMKSMYSAIKVNDFAEVCGGISMLQKELESAGKSMDEKLHWSLIHGNSSADTQGCDGLLSSISSSSKQFYSKNGTALTLDVIEDFLENYKSIQAKNSSESKKPTALLVDTKTYSKIRKLMLAKNSGIVTSGVITVEGIQFNALMYDKIAILECDDLRDYDSAVSAFTVAKLAGGDLADDEYFVNVVCVTANGICTEGTEASATTETTNNSIRITITAKASDVYYKIYWGETTGNANLKLIKTVEATGSNVVVDITTEPTQTYELAPDDANNGIMIACKLGGEDGLRIGMNQMKRFVKLGKVGDYESAYLRSYFAQIIKNPYSVAMMIHDLS